MKKSKRSCTKVIGQVMRHLIHKHYTVYRDSENDIICKKIGKQKKKQTISSKI